MMMQMPMDIAPTRMARAMLCSWTISFQRWYGVSLSITMNATMKTRIPIKGKTSAATILPSGKRFILFASGVMMITAINRTIGTRIIADRIGNVFELMDVVDTPAALSTESGG